MTGLVFVDTNVFLYALDERNPEKQAAARRWRELLWNMRKGRTSFQVLAEFYANVIRHRPQSHAEARAEVNDLLSWHPVVVDGELFGNAWKVQDRYRFSFWDALIVSAAKTAQCEYLLTEDLQRDQNLDGLKVINPFITSPESLLETE